MLGHSGWRCSEGDLLREIKLTKRPVCLPTIWVCSFIPKPVPMLGERDISHWNPFCKINITKSKQKRYQPPLPPTFLLGGNRCSNSLPAGHLARSFSSVKSQETFLLVYLQGIVLARSVKISGVHMYSMGLSAIHYFYPFLHFFNLFFRKHSIPSL